MALGNHLHENEITFNRDFVQKLILGQFPEYTDLPIVRLDASGSSNVLFRLGDELLVRLPRLPNGGSTTIKECRWLPQIAPSLTVPIPEIIALGAPAFDYTEHWSIVSWIEGETLPAADNSSEQGRLLLAKDLADAILELRALNVSDLAQKDPLLRNYRGSSLTTIDQETRQNINLCRSIRGLDVNLDDALTLWEGALNLPGAANEGPLRWYHGDLVCENLLTSKNRLTGVLDFGTLGIGDPTVDLHGAWEIFNKSDREVFRIHLGVDDSEWLRGRAWALAISVMVLSYYWNKMPGRAQDRLTMLKSVLE